MEGIEPKVKRAIDAALPTLVAAGQATDAEHVIASDEGRDLALYGLKKGETINIYPGSQLPAHIKFRKFLDYDPSEEVWLPACSRLKDGRVQLVLTHSDRSVTPPRKVETSIPPEDLDSKESMEQKIKALVGEGVLPKLTAAEMERAAWTVYGVTVGRKIRWQYVFAPVGVRTFTLIDDGGGHVFSPK